MVTDVAAKYDQHTTPPLCTHIITTRTMLHTAMSKAGVCLAVLLRRLYDCIVRNGMSMSMSEFKVRVSDLIKELFVSEDIDEFKR